MSGLVIVAFVAVLAAGVRAALGRAPDVDRDPFLTVPVRPLDRLRDGELVRIVGRVAAGPTTLAAPSDGAQCIAYDARFRETQSRYGVQVVARFANAETFALEVGDRRVEVDGSDLDLVLVNATWMHGPIDSFPGAVRATYRDGGGDPARAPRSLDYSERRVTVGELVAVLGILRWRGRDGAAHDGDYRSMVAGPTVLELVPAPGQKGVRLTTDPPCLR